MLQAEEALREQPTTAMAISAPRVNRAQLIARLGAAKRAFVTRRVSLDAAHSLLRTATPRSGDLVLAIVTEIGHHARIEHPDGRRAQLYVGDEIIVAYGERYAPDQFEAVVPKTLDPCDLVAGGGIAAQMLARHSSTRKPTAIQPVGLLADASGKAINLRDFAMSAPAKRATTRNVVAIVGTSMNAGKTTVAANLIRGLSQSGLRVGACKVTGTGSGGDLWSMIDAGAARALDFTDAGFSTTAGAPIEAIEECAHLLVSELEASDVDIVVVEIADGLLQKETAALLSPPSSFAARIDALFLAAADSMGALAGVEWLRARNLPLHAVSGLLTASPLAAREAQAGVAAEVISTKSLAEPEHAARLCLQVGARQPRSVVS